MVTVLQRGVSTKHARLSLRTLTPVEARTTGDRAVRPHTGHAQEAEGAWSRTPDVVELALA